MNNVKRLSRLLQNIQDLCIITFFIYFKMPGLISNPVVFEYLRGIYIPNLFRIIKRSQTKFNSAHQKTKF